MTAKSLTLLWPYIVVAATSVIVMLVISVRRNHAAVFLLTLSGLAVATALLFLPYLSAPAMVTKLVLIDRYALFYTGLIFAATFIVAALSYPYLELRDGDHEEFYVLLLIAALGASVLTASVHFASLFLGLETLTVSLYALTAYLRSSDRSIEAGVKYLILAAVSSAFILFGMALVYAELGTMEFAAIAERAAGAEVHGLPLTAGFAMIIIGLGFKLAVVPFHMWTPDVYEGAPAPVTAFVATVSKGAVFALVLRLFSIIDVHGRGAEFLIFTVIAVASMFTGNLLALLQNNVKRILAYSSISHLGYLLVAFLASGSLAAAAVAFYLTAYFVTTLGAFGVVTVLSTKERDADSMDDYRGLARQRPWVAGIFTAMLFSLAGIPLTAGFVGKFYVVAAGVDSGLWLLVVILIINSAIGLFYYLRIIIALYTNPKEGGQPTPVPKLSRTGGAVLASLSLLLLWLGVYPGPLIDLIKKTMQNF
ncbi:MAG: NADH-quinone oxidoreductase subunit N [Nitrospirota bacterium]